PYAAHFAPRPPALRPHCLARERLLLWLPLPSPANTQLSEPDRHLVFNILSRSLAPGTCETYGSGLLLFLHVICDTHSIPKHARAPATPSVLALFIAELVGWYSEAVIKNAVAAIRAWHILHRHAWVPNDNEISTLLRPAEKEAPRLRQPHAAFLLSDLRAIVAELNQTVHLDAVLHAALLVCFWGTAHLGELLPQTLHGTSGFTAQSWPTMLNLHHSADKDGNAVSVLHLPCTKVRPTTGEDIYWAPHGDSTDVLSALHSHLDLNTPPATVHLFSYLDKNRKVKTLTKTAFLNRLKVAVAAAGVSLVKEHSIRISSTTHYLLHGLSFEAMRVKGRWASNAFMLYLRRHAEIMAP
ncbi:hypothetical protein AURDEDRAFT_29215, partial [Auricularia subglabra TFB-10046 SS5]